MKVAKGIIVSVTRRAAFALFALRIGCSSLLAIDLDVQRVGNWPGYARGMISAAVAKGDYVYCAAGSAGLVILDAKNTNELRRVASFHSAGTAQDVYVEGNLAYVASGIPCLQIFDVSDPTKPRLVGELDASNMVSWSVQVRNGYAYLGNSINTTPQSVAVISVQDPSRPQFTSVLGGAETLDGFRIVGDRFYLAGANGLKIFNLTDPLRPQPLGEYFVPQIFLRGLAVDGNIVCATTTEGKLYVFDVTDAANPTLLSTYPSLNRPWGVSLLKSHAYVGEQDGALAIIDLSNPVSPRLASRYEVAGNDVMGSFAFGNFVYAVSYPSGLHRLDITDPDNPRFAGRYNELGYSTDLWIEGKIAFVADGLDGLKILDISIPSRPVEIGSYRQTNEVSDVVIVGNHAYITDGANGIRVLDVTDPRNVSPGRVCNTGGVPLNVEAFGNRLYVASGMQGLAVLNISNPSEPVVLQTYRGTNIVLSVTVVSNLAYLGTLKGMEVVDVTEGRAPQRLGFYRSSYELRDIKVKGDYAYAANWSSGLEVISVRDPARPSRLTQGSGTPARRIVLRDAEAYVAEGMYGIVIYDLKDPARPKKKASYDAVITDWNTAGFANGLWLDGNYLYIADWSDGLHALEIKRPANPQSVGSYYDGGDVAGVVVRDGFAYVADGYFGLRIIDVTDPTGPKLVGGAVANQGQASRNVLLEGNYCYLAQGTAGLAIVDLSKPATLMEIGRFSSFNTEIKDVAVVETKAFLATGGPLVMMVDLTEPRFPKSAGSFALNGQVSGLRKVGDLIYVASGDAGVQILKVTTPDSPSKVGELRLEGVASRLFVADGVAYIASGKGGLKLVDVTDPAQPRFLGEYRSRDAVNDVYVAGGVAYIASGWVGLEAIDVSNPMQPVRLGGNASVDYSRCVSGDANHIYGGAMSGLHIFDLFQPFRVRLAENGSQLRLHLFGPRGAKTKIEKSDDLATWFDVGEILLKGTQAEFPLEPISEGKMFYRSMFSDQ